MEALIKDGNTVQILVAVLGFAAALIGLITTIIAVRRSKPHEIIHRHIDESAVYAMPSGPVCPECSGRYFVRAKGMVGIFKRFVLLILIVGPIGLCAASLLFKADSHTHSIARFAATQNDIDGESYTYTPPPIQQPDARVTFQGMFCVMLLLWIPALIWWRASRQPLLKCRNCGAKVPA